MVDEVDAEDDDHHFCPGIDHDDELTESESQSFRLEHNPDTFTAEPLALPPIASLPKRKLPRTRNPIPRKKIKGKTKAAPHLEEQEPRTKVGQAQHTIAEQRGPFPTVYSRHHEALRAVRCYAFPQKGRQLTQYGETEEKATEESQEEKGKVYLMVGDKIRNDHPTWGLTFAHILDFRRGSIVIGWRKHDLEGELRVEEGHSITLLPDLVDNFLLGKYTKKELDELPFAVPRESVRLEGKTIMVRRNPSKSRGLIEKKRAETESQNTSAVKRAEAASGVYTGAVPMSETREVLGSSEIVHPFINIEDLPPEGRVLSDLPELRPPALHYDETKPRVDPDGTATCIFCGKPCDLLGCQWNEILDLNEENKSKSKEQGYYLDAHVHARPGDHPILAPQFDKSLRWNENEILTAKDIIQYRLEGACRSFPLVLGDACQAACDDPGRRNDRDLKIGIDRIFVAALASNNEKEKIQTRGRSPPYKAEWTTWITGIEPVLRVLRERMLSFDFTVVLDTLPDHVPNSKGFMLWNYLNVFFLRGFYFEEGFPWTVDLTYDDKPVPPTLAKDGEIEWLKWATDEQKEYWSRIWKGGECTQNAKNGGENGRNRRR